MVEHTLTIMFMERQIPSIYYRHDKMLILGGINMELTFKDAWCTQAFEIMHDAHPEWPEVKLRKKIEDIFDKKFYDPKCTLTNNYLAVSKRTTLSCALLILINGLVILGGDGCMFMQHSQKLSLLAKWISVLKKKRKSEKRERDIYDKGSPDWRKHDLNQKNIKVLINSLYGILGYMKFHLFNVNLAQSVTAMGQAIISTATCAFENFMADNIKFVNMTEAAIYIMNIKKDFKEVYEDNQLLFQKIPVISINDVALRLKEKMGFNMTKRDADLLIRLLLSCNEEELKLIYYKNNVEEFLNIPFVRQHAIYMFDEITVLRLGELSAFDTMGESWNSTVATENAKALTEEFINMARVIVEYKHQIFDRVRRTKYTNKKSVLYIDTDSNFLSLDKFVRYSLSLDARGKDTEDYRFKAVSIFTIMMSTVVTDTYESFTDSLNIDKEHGKIIGMKNEFFFDRIYFGLAKKRYIGRMLIQEGKLITNPDKQREIKGFDFIKAAVKSNIQEAITDLIDRHMLFTTENIDLRQFLRDIRSFEKEIKDRIFGGDNSFFRQVTVQEAKRYVSPLSNQGYKSAFIWNALMPGIPHEFPSEVDIIPLTLDTGMTDKKYLMLRDDPEGFFNSKFAEGAIHMKKFYYEHHDIFMEYYNNILRNPKITYIETYVDEKTKKTSQKFRTLTMTSIAKPRSLTELPDWLIDIIDINKIINNVVSLINPILDPLGPKTLQTSSTTAHYSNIVDV